jgi:hypothetical protein
MPWALEEPTLMYVEGICRTSQINDLARSEFWYLMMDRQRGRCAGVINFHSIQWNVPKFENGCEARWRILRRRGGPDRCRHRRMRC